VQIKEEFDIIDGPCILLKAITFFKGLGKDILFLRAKFKLYFFEYSF